MAAGLIADVLILLLITDVLITPVRQSNRVFLVERLQRRFLSHILYLVSANEGCVYD